MYYQDRLDQNSAGPTTSRALVPQWAWTRRNVDDPLFPRSGNLIHAEAGFAIKGVLTDQTFIRGYARGQQYLPIGRRDLFVFRAVKTVSFEKGLKILRGIRDLHRTRNELFEDVLNHSTELRNLMASRRK